MKWKVIIALLISHVGYTQIEVGSLYEELPNDSIIPLSLNHHSNIRPFIRYNNHFNPKFSAKISFGDSNRLMRITPILDAGFMTDTAIAFRSGIGVSLTSCLKEKWYFKVSLIEGFGKSISNRFQPKSMFYKQDELGNYTYTDVRGRISYTPNHIFNFQAGIDHNFIGEGNRSLLLSDYTKPYPFAAIRANFWRFEYMTLYQFLQEEAPNQKWKSKYMASHILSFNATKWLNLGIFETVIFAPKDTLLNRGFDAEYLNPVIFYRPQEYSMGSADNVILGFQFSVKYLKHTLYGQAVLDEFLLSELKAKSQWWGNKYGGQIGIKGRFIESGQPFFYRIELNFVRPYTYSHASTGQNYGNQGFSMAHPYGANFSEALAELKWQHQKWIVKGFANYFLHGSNETDSVNYGGDIYTSYNSHPKEYGNYIGQGLKNNGVRIMLSAAYLIDKSINLQLFVEGHLRKNLAYSEPDFQLVVGIRSCLWNDYRNY